MPYSPPPMPVITRSRTTIGAAVIECPEPGLPTAVFQMTAPVFASSDTRRPSIVPM